MGFFFASLSWQIVQQPFFGKQNIGMEGVAAQSDSDPEHSWECKAGYYVCFKDCCQRINQFCNEHTKRCELCSTRSAYCGNDSLPVHCDAWCLQQKYSHNTGLKFKIGTFVLW